MKNTKPLVRLDSLPQGATRLTVDRTFPGRIKNVSIVTTGPALGHGFEVDKTTVEQVARFASGIRGRWTHGGLSDDGLARHLGTWEGVRAHPFRFCRTCELEASATSGSACTTCNKETSVEWRATGEFVFAASAHKLRPDGLDVPAPVYLMDRAEEDPRSLGISIVAHFGFDEVADADVEPERSTAAGAAVEQEDGGQRRGGEDADEDAPPPRRLARIAVRADLKRGDWVADPVANPLGLSARNPAPQHAGTGAPSALTEEATQALDRIVARDGATKAKLRALAFLARYFGDDRDAHATHSDDGDAHDAAACDAEHAALRARIDAFEREAASRRQAEVDGFLERLRAESAAAQAPIPDEDMERVAALMRDGQAETARIMGELLLTRSKARGQIAFERGGSLPLTPRETPPEKASAETQARVLRRRGWTVDLNEGGTALTRAVPPGGK